MTSYIHKLKLYKNSPIANRFFRVDNLYVDNTMFTSKVYLNGYSAIIAILSHCAMYRELKLTTTDKLRIDLPKGFGPPPFF